MATCTSGRVEVLVNCSPLFNYGTTCATWTYSGDGYDSMRVATREGSLELSITGTIPLGVLSSRCYGRTTIAAGESAFVTLSWGENTIPATQDEAFRALNHTIDFWRDWLSTAKVSQHLGNFPQAFTHLALIEAVSLLIALEPEGHSFAFSF
jgi:alpha,alpha-trehalase